MLEAIWQALVSVGQWLTTLNERTIWAIILGILAVAVLFWDERIHKQEMARQAQKSPHAQETNHKQAE